MLDRLIENKGDNMDDNANIYERQEFSDLGIRFPSGPIAVIGLGGVGCWTTIFLTLSGVTAPILLVDGDTLQPENLNRLPFTQQDIGRPKAEVVAEFCRRVRPEVNISVFPIFLDDTTIDLVLANCEVVICATDSLASQELIHSYCIKQNKVFIKAGCDGNHVTVCHDMPTWEAGTRDAGYITPSWAVPTVFAACLAVFKTLVSPKLDFGSSLWDVGVSREGKEIE